MLIVSDPATRPCRPPLNHSSIVHTRDKAEGEISQTRNTMKHEQISLPAANTLPHIGR